MDVTGLYDDEVVADSEEEDNRLELQSIPVNGEYMHHVNIFFMIQTLRSLLEFFNPNKSSCCTQQTPTKRTTCAHIHCTQNHHIFD